MQKYVIVENGEQLEKITALNSWRREFIVPCLEIWKEKAYFLNCSVYQQQRCIVHVPRK